ncbi:MAG: metallophosphoesterase [Oscillospiraceae bacterium]|jgi:predicted MPP superfamily phosphohydrolase|nr:metallophosphoesterase [Oscillospiraceae bacterium]MCI9548828.1 metallophosphoesterase [Oscillospiraceae bacterium]
MTATDREGGPHRPRNRRRRPLRWLAALAVLAAGGWAWFQWQCWGLQTTRTQAALPGLPAGFDGYKIVHLSDLHGHQYGEDSGELLDRVREEGPDLIVITGDLIDQESQLAMVPALARGLAAVAPAYYVTGNHEWALGTGAVRELKNVLSQCGVTVLSNQYQILERDGAQIVLAGVDDPNGYADQTSPEELAAAIQADQPGLFTLLLAHRNDHFGQYANAGYDFVMSGHGHGGIVRLPLVGGLIGTDRRFFPPWTAGVYAVGDSTLFVSRGLGNNTVPYKGFRIFDRPELAVVTLRAKG